MIFRSIRKRLKLFSILSSLILLTPTGSGIHACWYGPESEELRYMLFNPDLAHDKSWWSFFYNAHVNYLDGTTRTDSDEQMLTAEWLTKLKLKTDPQMAFDCFFGSLTDSALALNPVFQALQKQAPYREYFDVARRCEEISMAPYFWPSDRQKNDAVADGRNELLESLPARVADERNPFLKKKYAFQLSKLAFYANDRALFNQTYNRYFSKADRDVLYWWATHYKSVMLEREAQVDSANYLHALVFAHSGSKRYISRQFFTTKRLEAVLALAQNDHERADILVLAEAINPGRSLERIREIYALNPEHKLLPLLVNREINKLEDWLGTTKYAGADKSVYLQDDNAKSAAENWKSDFAYLEEVVQALEDMNKLSLFSGYDLSMSYLYLLRGDGAAAAQHLSRIQSTDPEVQYQVQVQQVVLLTLQEDIMNPAVQEKLGRMVQALIDGSAQKFESEKMLYSLSSYLRYVFANKGSIVLAGLFDNLATNKFCYTCSYNSLEYSMISYFDGYASAADVVSLIALHGKPDKNALEALLLKPYSNPYYLYDLLATKYLREGQVKSAAQVLQKVPDEFWFSFKNALYYIDQDPFFENAELLTSPTMATYNKREILERMIQLEAEAVGDPSRRATNYLQLANAWYNFTDNSWFMIDYGTYALLPRESSEQIKAYAIRKAVGYYRQALAVTTDAETRVKIWYMLAALSDNDTRKAYAKEYEQYSETDFYTRRNCLTLKDLARKM